MLPWMTVQRCAYSKLEERPLDPVAIEEMLQPLLAMQADGLGIALDEVTTEQLGTARCISLPG